MPEGGYGASPSAFSVAWTAGRAATRLWKASSAGVGIGGAEGIAEEVVALERAGEIVEALGDRLSVDRLLFGTGHEHVAEKWLVQFLDHEGERFDQADAPLRALRHKPRRLLRDKGEDRDIFGQDLPVVEHQRRHIAFRIDRVKVDT